MNVFMFRWRFPSSLYIKIKIFQCAFVQRAYCTRCHSWLTGRIAHSSILIPKWFLSSPIVMYTMGYAGGCWCYIVHVAPLKSLLPLLNRPSQYCCQRSQVINMWNCPWRVAALLSVSTGSQCGPGWLRASLQQSALPCWEPVRVAQRQTAQPCWVKLTMNKPDQPQWPDVLRSC